MLTILYFPVKAQLDLYAQREGHDFNTCLIRKA